MKKIILIKKLQEIKDKGFIPSTRAGPTGVGHTFETVLGLKESNISVPDLGGKIEVKAIRENSTSLITLFTFDKGVWKFPQAEIVRKYGYLNSEGRIALKNTLYYGKPIPQRLHLEIDDVNQKIHIVDNNQEIVGTFSLLEIGGIFFSKMRCLLLGVAKSSKHQGKEYFNFTEFYLLSDPTVEKFIQALKKGLVGIDLRMHLKPDGGVRNRGTAFRIKEKDLIELYAKREKLV